MISGKINNVAMTALGRFIGILIGIIAGVITGVTFAGYLYS